MSNILANDYNTLQSEINTILGSSYGQTVSSSQISSGGTIYASDWNKLSNDISITYTHQFGVNLDFQLLNNRTIITNIDKNLLSSVITSIANNTLMIDPSQGTINNIDNYSTNGNWSGLLTEIITVNFNSSNDMNYYFNSGGNFTLNSSTTSTNNDFITLITGIGTITFNKISTNGSGIGYVNLTSSYQQIFSSTNGYLNFKISSLKNSNNIIFKIDYSCDISLTNHYNPIILDGITTTNINAFYANVSVIVNKPILSSGYYISQNKSLIFEESSISNNNTVEFNIKSVNVSTLTNLYWVVNFNSGNTSNPTLSATSGSVLVNNNFKISAGITSGEDTSMKSFTVKFYSDSSHTNLIVESLPVYVIQHGSITLSSGFENWIVPNGITSLSVEVVGGGGGGGGNDASSNGHVGYGGIKLNGMINVLPGDEIEAYIGSGGGYGISNTNNTTTFAMGGNGYSKGGNGGTAGTLGTSGAGGAGGGSTALTRNRTLIAVASGGSGGGGAGYHSAGLDYDTSNQNTLNTNNNGSNGANKGNGDGGGAGGGAGGYLHGGLGGLTGSGDNGAYSGYYGDSLVPPSFTETISNNGGTSGFPGGYGYITLTW